MRVCQKHGRCSQLNVVEHAALHIKMYPTSFQSCHLAAQKASPLFTGKISMSLHQALPVEGELQMRPDSLKINRSTHVISASVLNAWQRRIKSLQFQLVAREKRRVSEMFWMWRLRPQQVAACPDGPDGVALACHASA